MSRRKWLVRGSVIAGAMLLAASPLAAQDNSAESEPPAPATDNIGPRELSNFSLSGTVTRQAEPEQAPQAPPAAARAPARDAQAAASSESRTPAPRQAVARVAGQLRDASSAASQLDPLAGRPSLASSPDRTQGAPLSTATPAAAGALTGSAPADSGFSPLPWIAALFLAAAAAAIYFGLQRRRGGYAAAGVSEFVGRAEPQAPRAPRPAPAPRPGPAPLARAPVPEPPSEPDLPTGRIISKLRDPEPPKGLVTAGLRPWIELELEPSQALVTDEHAAIAFDVTLYNSGSAPARDVAIEACLINAGEQQDVQLSRFYTAPSEVRDKIPSVAPLSKITFKSAVRLPRSAVQEYEVGGRKMFMPMVAVNSRYRWSSGEGQSAASFLVGRAANDSDKLGPLRLDQGSRGWKALAARRYEKGIRR